MTDYQAPDITEYIHVKDKHKKLQQSIHTWERKVAIAEVKKKKKKVFLSQIKRALCWIFVSFICFWNAASSIPF